MSRCWAILLVAGTAAVLTGRAAADTLTIPSSKDNTLYEFPDGSRSNGSGEWCFTGRTGGGEIRRALMAFDVAGVIAPGSTITGVTLTLQMSRTSAGPRPVALHRVLADWGEGASLGGGGGGGQGGGGPSEPGDATWIHTFFDTAFWTAAGGDYAAVSSAVETIDFVGDYSWTDPALISDVQGWLNTPAANFGWAIVGDESAPFTAKRFDTREHPDPAMRPRLTITFTPPVGSGSCCLGPNLCGVLFEADCLTAGGTYNGDGSVCTPNPCAPPTGACCPPNAACTIATSTDCATVGGTYQGDGTVCAPDPCPIVLTPYVDPLPIPAVAVPVGGAPGATAVYDIAMTEFEHQFHSELPPTTVWGYGGTVPGPTIEAGRDQPVTVRWINDLRDGAGDLRTVHLLPVDLCPHGPDHHGPSPRTVVHLHGAHAPAVYDGYPEDTFLPGMQDEYVYPNHQLPATLWYHDHALGITRLNVYLGLFGFYLVRDAAESALDLPAGAHEIPLAIFDRAFNPDGSLQYPAAWQDHFFGDKIAVNGTVWPVLDVDRGKYRFRVLNGSNARTLALALSDGATFWQIGSEGGLFPAPVSVTQITLAPAERADVIIDFGPYAAGTELLLVNSAPAPYPGSPGVGVVPDVMKFVVQPAIGHTAAVPTSLRPMEVLDEGDAVIERTFELSQAAEPCAGSTWLINGLVWDDITEFPQLGSTEVWTFINRSGMMHPMHLHLSMFQVLDRQDFVLDGGDILPIGTPQPPDAVEAGWKDTVRVNPFEIVRVITRFEDYTGKFAYHCHILEHEDHEMMRQFEVIGDVPAMSTWGAIVLSGLVVAAGLVIIRRRRAVV